MTITTSSYCKYLPPQKTPQSTNKQETIWNKRNVAYASGIGLCLLVGFLYRDKLIQLVSYVNKYFDSEINSALKECSKHKSLHLHDLVDFRIADCEMKRSILEACKEPRCIELAKSNLDIDYQAVKEMKSQISEFCTNLPTDTAATVLSEIDQRHTTVTDIDFCPGITEARKHLPYGILRRLIKDFGF
jgi:hypothetical protein